VPAFRALLPLALASAGLAGGALVGHVTAAGPPPALLGAHDPAWAPGLPGTHGAGGRIALSIHDQLWTLSADGRDPRAVVRWADHGGGLERDPSWSRDGRQLAFAARLDAGGFDLYVVDARGGAPRRLTALPGDERWPSWLPDGRLVFAGRDRGQWDLFLIDPRDPAPAMDRLTDTTTDETEPSVSPDGRLVAFVSPLDSADGEADLWLLELSGRVAVGANGPTRPDPVPLVRDRGAESSPAWAPDGERLAYSVAYDGGGSIRIVHVARTDAGRSGAGDAGHPAKDPSLDASGDDDLEGAPFVVSRHPGQVAWSPDGRTLLVTDLAARDRGYNGQPQRGGDAGPTFAAPTDRGAHFLDAPAPPDATARPLRAAVRTSSARRLATFDALWEALVRRAGPGADGQPAWQALRDRHRPRAAAAGDAAAFEDVTDALIAEAPPIAPAVTSRGGLIVSAHPLASEAGARALRAGGNAVDAAIAASFALGVVEPDASGIGGDGMALVWPAGAPAPVVVDFKDQAPASASLDHPAVLRDGRLVDHGPAALNVPGVVAGLDHLHRRYGSGRVAWADLVAPAIGYAADGFVLDGTLPATVAEGQATLRRYEGARALLLPGGRLPLPGDRFVNADLAATLRTIAAHGADAFYRGELAGRIVDDLTRHGGLLSREDLEQYRVVERAPVRGTYRGHVVFSTPPPVASGTTLIEVLQTLDRRPPLPGARLAANADVAHLLIETFRAVHHVRAVDPAIWPDESAAHLAPAHAVEVFGRIDPQRASPRRPATDEDGAAPAGSSGAGAAAAAAPADRGGDDDPERAPSRLGRGTSALVAVDRAGTVVVVTQTLSTWGGSFYVSPGLGFLYNNHLRMARARRGTPGALTPHARSSSANASTIVCREIDGRLVPRLALGAAGSAWIVPSVVEVIQGVVDGGLGAQAAVEAPRLRVDETGEVQIEDRFPRRVVGELARRGHVITRIGGKGELRYGFVSAVAFGPEPGILEAGADPRRSHAAVAVP
jgi:gamma-glutamyltranspeptidase